MEKVLHKVHDCVLNNMDKQQLPHLVSRDLSTAFDTADHKILKDNAAMFWVSRYSSAVD